MRSFSETQTRCATRRAHLAGEVANTCAFSVLKATIMTDPDTANRTYIGPMTPELIEGIIAKARR